MFYFLRIFTSWLPVSLSSHCESSKCLSLLSFPSAPKFTPSAVLFTLLIMCLKFTGHDHKWTHRLHPFCTSPSEFRGIFPLSLLITCFSLVSPSLLPHDCQKSTYRTYWLYHTQILHCQWLPSASLVEFKFCISEMSSVQVSFNTHMTPLHRIILRMISLSGTRVKIITIIPGRLRNEDWEIEASLR